MPKGVVIATTLALGVGMSSVVAAMQGPHTTRGWVSAVDVSAKTIKVKGKNDEVTFKLEDNGKVMEQSKAATFADLKPGEHVLIHYTGSGADRVASLVDILAQAPSDKSPAKAEK